MNGIYDLRIDVDRLKHFEKRNDENKVKEYKELIVTHAKELVDNTNINSNEQEVKEIITVEILNQMNDQSAAMVLREVLFDENNLIDWNKVGESIIRNMPEMIV